MTKHKTQVDGFASLAELAETVSNLRYDALRDFLGSLEEKLQRDSAADLQRGRPLLSHTLHRARYALGEARIHIAHAWTICEPYMGHNN